MYPKEIVQMKSIPCMKLFTAALGSKQKRKGQVKTEQQLHTSQPSAEFLQNLTFALLINPLSKTRTMVKYTTSTQRYGQEPLRWFLWIMMLKWPTHLPAEAGGEEQRFGVSVPIFFFKHMQVAKHCNLIPKIKKRWLCWGGWVICNFFSPPVTSGPPPMIDSLNVWRNREGREGQAGPLGLWLPVALSHNNAGRAWNPLGAQPSYNPLITHGETNAERKWFAQDHKARLEATSSACSFL